MVVQQGPPHTSGADVHRLLGTCLWGGWTWHRTITGQRDDRPVIACDVNAWAPSHSHSSPPLGLVMELMSLSGACAILKLCHQLRGEGRMTKQVNTSDIGRQQGNRGKRIPKERRRANINAIFPGLVSGFQPYLHRSLT